MSLRNRIATAALIGLSLVTTLALAPMTFGQAPQTPAPPPQPAVAPAPMTFDRAAQTLTPTARPATTPAVMTLDQSDQTPTPIAQPATAPAPITFGAAPTLSPVARPATAPAAMTLQTPPAPSAAAPVPTTFGAAHTISPVARWAMAPAAMTVGQAAQTPTPSAQPAAAPKATDYVEEKGFKGRVFEVKNRDPLALMQAIRPLGSGFKGSTMAVDRDFRTLTVRDFPENLASIEEAIKRLDTPDAPHPDIEFSVHVLIASDSVGGPENYPAELADVVKQLKSALKYKSYRLMTSGIHRGKEGHVSIGNSGVAESNLFSSVPTPPNPIFYEYSLESISIDSGSGTPTVQVGGFRFNMRVPLNMGNSVQYENVGFRSPVGLRQGEKVVVGSTTMGDKGLVVVVSAKLLK